MQKMQVPEIQDPADENHEGVKEIQNDEAEADDVIRSHRHSNQ